MLARLDVPYLAAHAGRVPDAGAVGRVRARPAAGRGHHDGGDPRARRRDRPDRLRRPRRRAGKAARLPRGCTSRRRRARHACLRRARRDARRARREAGRAAPHASAPSARSRSCCSTSRPTPATPAPPPTSSVFESLFNTLRGHEARRATRSSVPADVDALRERMLEGNAERFGAAANVHARIPADDHVRRERWLARDRSASGARRRAASRATARRSSCWASSFGNVFVGVQPAFGYEGDPMRLLFEKRLRADACLLGLLPLAARGFRRRMRCCTSAPTARSSSCPASRPACRPPAGPTG